MPGNEQLLRAPHRPEPARVRERDDNEAGSANTADGANNHVGKAAKRMHCMGGVAAEAHINGVDGNEGGNDDDDEEYEVRRIIDHRIGRDGHEFLVDWMSDGEHEWEPSWEPLAHLHNAMDAVLDLFLGE